MKNIPWEKIYEINLKCGSINDLISFTIEVVNSLKELCDYDQALVYFLDGNGKVYNQHLINIDRQWSTMYLEYYSKVENGRYGFIDRIPDENALPTVNIVDWDKEPSSEFILNYIRPRGLKHSLGFLLYDPKGRARALIVFDRTSSCNFTSSELRNLNIIIPLLNNLHKKFFLQKEVNQRIKEIAWETTPFTPREIEIANMLCQGITPANISRILYISQSTTNKHIANIYKKMQVSSLQELLVRLLG